MASIETVNYKGWERSLKIVCANIELVVTTDVGPRIIFFGIAGSGVNELGEFEEESGLKGGDKWRLYGGHRLWHAPELWPRTYEPDNAPVEVVQKEICDQSATVELRTAPEPTTKIQKTMTIQVRPTPGGSAVVQIDHYLTNAGLWTIDGIACWAPTVLAPGGRAVVPLPERGPHSDPKNLSPKSSLSLWSYTDMSDPRWTWGKKYIMLQQDPTVHPDSCQKVGALVPSGWSCYMNHGNALVKKFSFDPTANYPDYNSVVQLFTNNRFLEVETMGPLMKLAPGCHISHTEEWRLAPLPSQTCPKGDSEVDTIVLPTVVRMLADA